MRPSLRAFLPIAAILCGAAQPTLAQEKPAPIVEIVIGRSGFIDEKWDYYTTIGAGARMLVTRRLAIGPEIAYLAGNSDDPGASSLSITGTLTFDFIRDDGSPRVVPYFVAGGGYLRQKTLVGRGPGSPGLRPFTSGEGTVSGGMGARIALGSRIFVSPEFRLGWEPETRIAVMIGIRTR